MYKLIRHFNILFKSYIHFGFSGFIMTFSLLYIHKNNNKIKTFKLKGLQNEIAIRIGSTDFLCFLDVFIEEAYKLDSISISPQWIIDCGANVGFGTIYFKFLFPQSKIVAVEMEDNNFEMLSRNLQKYDKVFLEKAAIWSSSNSYLKVENRNREWGYVVKNSISDNSSKVQAITINEVAKKYNMDIIDIVKMDIEGAEKEIFDNGDLSWLKKTKCLIIELHDRINPGTSKVFFNAISQYNFSVSISSENLVFRNNDI